MAKIIGDVTGTTWDDWIIHPGNPFPDRSFTPEDVDISVDLAGVKLEIPFLAAAMRSVVDADLTLEAGKLGMMAVAPRGLEIGDQTEIIKHVKKNAVKVGDIESEHRPVRVYDFSTLGHAITKAKKTGHKNIPVVTYKADFLGMFEYRPLQHDSMDPSTPIMSVTKKFEHDNLCRTGLSDDTIRDYLQKNGLRLVPVIDDIGRLDRLVFLQDKDIYKVGGAIDTKPGWEKRAESLIEAGADMIFIDTSDGDKIFSYDVVGQYKRLFPKGPPICGGNVVTPGGFLRLAEAGADLVKLGMGPGSICTTNEVLGVGASPFSSLVFVAIARDEYFKKNEIYIPLVADGGIEGVKHVAVASTHADAIMGGRLFNCFLESAGGRLGRDGRFYRKGEIEESDVVAIRTFGEGSREAVLISGNMDRYAPSGGISTYQGVSGTVPYKGRIKPGVKAYVLALKESLYHAGVKNLIEFREFAELERLSEGAKGTAKPHGIKVLE